MIKHSLPAQSNDELRAQYDQTTAPRVVSLAHTDLGEIPFSIQDALTEVTDMIAPVWPLQDYIAVNPYAGLSSKRFLDARQFMQSYSDCELLMPLEYYSAAFAQHRFGNREITAAMEELTAEGLVLSHSCEQIATRLIESKKFLPAAGDHFAHRSFSRMKTIAEIATKANGIDWTEVIRDEVSKHCAAHYDEGQATWPSPWADRSLYEAWRAAASCDRNVEILGLSGFRAFVAELPPEPSLAIAHMLSEINVPARLWTTFLMCQAFSIPGWFAWAKYQTAWKHPRHSASDRQGESDLVGLLAIRLAYDVALLSAKSLSVQWSGLSRGMLNRGTPLGEAQEEIAVRMVLLRQRTGLPQLIAGLAEYGRRRSLKNGLTSNVCSDGVLHRRPERTAASPA